MAKNLREKISKSDTMVINDVNDAATQKFVEEVGNVTIAKSVREVAEQTVRRTMFEAEMTCSASFQSLSSDVKIVLSMILSAMLHSDYILTIHKI
jgi:Tfp pilus assembly major pilin PilA